MANEVTYARIKHLLPEIWEATLFFIQQNFVAPQTVKLFTDQRGFQARNVSEYVEDTSVSQNLGELTDLTPELFERELLNRLVPAENGKMYLLTDRRIETDDANIVADAARAMGYALGKRMELDIFGDFASLTGGYINKTNAALTWLDIFNGRARLAAAGVPGPYSVVLHEYHWLDLASAANIAGSSLQPVLAVRNDIQSQYYIPTMNDMRFYVSGLLPIDGNADAFGAIYNRDALALDMRRGLRLETERDASLRATELVGTMVYAHGVWRPSWGVLIGADATAPGTDVTQNSVLAIFGMVDDATVSTGADATFTFLVVNNGSVTARGVEVTFTVDSDFTHISNDPQYGSFSPTTKIWNGFDLAPGQSARLELVYDIAGSGDMVGTITDVTPITSGADPAATVSMTAS